MSCNCLESHAPNLVVLRWSSFPYTMMALTVPVLVRQVLGLLMEIYILVFRDPFSPLGER